MSADLWAGAEVQVATTASYLVKRPEVVLTAVLFNEGRLARELRTLGVGVAVVDEHEHSASGILAFLIRFLKAHRVDILHTHRYKDTVLGAVAGKLAGVPHVVRTVHGLTEPMRGWDRMKFKAYDALDKMVLWHFADRVIPVSTGMAETLRDSGYRRSAVTPIHNGVDLGRIRATRDRHEVRQSLGIASGALLVGTVGRLSPVKAHADLLRAARLILQEVRDARFLIVGDGPLERELRALAARLGLEDACLFAGRRDDTCDLVAAMDIFVLPSLHEGIPMALLEAMAIGTPVVATAVGGVPEVVTDRVSGVLVEPRDERALADACLELARDRHAAQALAACARRRVETRFSHEVNGDALVDAYRSIAAGPASERTTAADVGPLRLSWDLTRGLLQIAGRRVGRAIDMRRERQRMIRIRHRPEVLTTALRSARRILMVCHGNIIRSPFAANLVAQALGDDAQVAISSGGLGAVPGNPPHPTALQIATTRRVDLSNHAASAVLPDAVATSDVIFVMDIPQLLTMHRRFPGARAKTFLLGCLAADAPLEIRDPVDGDESRFHACFDHIARAVHPIVGTLRDSAVSS